MKTVRDHLASSPSMPAPPSGATHVLCWEPQPGRKTRWELAALDGPPDDDVPVSHRPVTATARDLAQFAACALDRPVTLSARFEVQDDDGTAAGYYVTPR